MLSPVFASQILASWETPNDPTDSFQILSQTIVSGQTKNLFLSSVCYSHEEPTDAVNGEFCACWINFSRPFTYTGVDFAGPFEIKRYNVVVHTTFP